MAININPNRINTQAGSLTRPDTGKPQEQSAKERIIVPARADVNTIPASETLQTMIRSAVSSLRQGVAWERGTILNLMV